ncbi:MAG: PE-PPE domain-containing protein [Mycobacterium sp.]|nr:PE-PPE domain-containing protein [Mycobacterium sp.]
MPDPVDGAPGAPVDLLLSSTMLLNPRRDAEVPTLPAPAVASALPLPASGAVLPAAAENIALIIGASGIPLPRPFYVDRAMSYYVLPNTPPGITPIPQALFTPEGFYPLTPYPYIKVLPINVSVDQGSQILYDEILQQVANQNTVTVFGYSQSAVISSLMMNPDYAGCVNTPTCGLDPETPVNFVLVGNEMTPNGGIFARLPGLNLPSLGIPFYGAALEDSFPVANYMLEYDGFADFPQYPLNVLSTLNALLGMGLVHTRYTLITPEQLALQVERPTTSVTQKYYAIPTEDLPLLAPIRLIPVIGNPIADLLQPALRVIVNLGYGDPDQGWSLGYANVPTPIGVFPDVDWGETIQRFFDGVAQGVNDFMADITPGGSMWRELESHATGAAEALTAMAAGLTTPPTLNPGGIIPALQSAITGITEFVSYAAASIYAVLLPTADFINAMVTTVPAYAFSLFLDGIEQTLNADDFDEVVSGLINAVGLPLAATVAMSMTFAMVEIGVIASAVTSVLDPSAHISAI